MSKREAKKKNTTWRDEWVRRWLKFEKKSFGIDHDRGGKWG